MPYEMIYCWNKNTISVDSTTKLSGYGNPEPQETNVKVYAFGNVDAFGSMALTWINDTIENDILIEDVGLDSKKYPNHQKIQHNTLSGWISCSNRCLKPKNP